MATEAEKEAAAKAREQIEVTNNKKEPEKEEEKIEVKEEEKEVVEAKEDEIETSDEKVEELEDKLEDKTLTAADRAKLETRIEKERKKNKSLRDENEVLKRQLADKPEGEKTYTEEEVERRSEEKAVQKAAVKEFNASVKRIADSCEKIDKDFSTKVNAMVEEVSGAGTYLPSVMVGILDDLNNNGGNVLMHLAANPDEYEEIYQLSPARMALKLKEIETDIITKEKKIKTKEISKVPEPKDTLKGKGTTPEARANEKDDMETFVRKRAQETEERRKLRMH